MSVDEGESGLPIFRCKADGVDGNREGFLEKVLRHPQQCLVFFFFFAALGVTVSHHLSSLKFFGFNRPPVRRAIDLALEKPVEDSAPGPSTSSSSADSIIPLVLPGRGKAEDRIIVWHGVRSFGTRCEDQVPHTSAWIATYSFGGVLPLEPRIPQSEARHTARQPTFAS